MGRLTYILTLDKSGMDQAMLSMGTLGDVLGMAGIEEFPVSSKSEGLMFGKMVVARFCVLPPRKGVVRIRVVPTVGMTLMVAEVKRLVPSVFVVWQDAWPMFRLGDDPDEEADPIDLAPDEMVPA